MPLADNQKGLADETAEVAKKDLGGAPVFARLVRRSAEAMEKASEHLAAMVTQPPELDALPDEEAGRTQQGAAPPRPVAGRDQGGRRVTGAAAGRRCGRGRWGRRRWRGAGR